MSKIDELKRVYIDELCASDGDVSAAIAAVVRALRDEVINKAKVEPYLDVGDVIDVVNDILGDAGNDPAPVYPDEPLVVSPTGLGLSPAPAPAVCEWTPRRAGSELHDTACGKAIWRCDEHAGICLNCKAPIKFTEAQR